MGMDVMGKNPTTERGAYFRNNVWWWHPLWDYCAEVSGDLITEKLWESGHYNDGTGLDADNAKKLGNILLEEVKSGRTAKYEEEYRSELASLPMDDCVFCNSTGIRMDEIGIKHGMHDRALEPEIAIIVGRTHGFCNNCKGYGRVKNFATNYPFDVRNVEKFAAFCIESGGFEIW